MKKIFLLALALFAGAALSAQTVIGFTASAYKESAEKYIYKHPFVNIQLKELAPSLKDAAFVGEAKDFVVRGEDGKEWTFIIRGTKGVVRNTVGGIMWGGAKDDYCQFPTVPGKKLVKVEVNSGKDYPTYAPTIVKADGSPVEGGDSVKAPLTRTEDYVWNLSGTTKKDVLKLVNNDPHFFGIRSIKLTYE